MGNMIEPTGGGVGSFVNGVDLKDNLSDNLVGELRNALGEYGVLFFRDQNLPGEQNTERPPPAPVLRFHPAKAAAY